MRIDMDEVRALAREHRPKLIIAGGSAYSRIIDFARFREIADEVGAYLHGGHGAFRRPGGGRRASQSACPRPCGDHHHPQDPARSARRHDPVARCEDIGKKINSAVFPGLQGGPLDACDRRQGGRLRRGVEARIQDLCEGCGRERQERWPRRCKSSGLDIVSGGTDTHLMLVDLRPKGAKGRPAEKALDRAGHHLQQERHSLRHRKGGRSPPASGWASPAGTTRGFGAGEFREIGKLIVEVVEAVAKERSRRRPGRGQCGAPRRRAVPPFPDLSITRGKHALPILRT